jgi:hypothetical protein
MQRRVRIPAKPNAGSEGKLNGIAGDDYGRRGTSCHEWCKAISQIDDDADNDEPSLLTLGTP